MIPFSKAELAGLQLEARRLFNNSSLRVRQLGWAAVANVRGELVAYDDEGGNWYVLSYYGKPVTGIDDVQARQQAARSGQPANEPHRLSSWRPFHSDSSLLERVLSAVISTFVALYVVNIIDVVVSDPSMQLVMRVTIIITAVIAAYAILLYLLPLNFKRKD